jgi:hypothetical protein
MQTSSRRRFFRQAGTLVGSVMTFSALGTLPAQAGFIRIGTNNCSFFMNMADCVNEGCKVVWGPPVNGSGNESCTYIVYSYSGGFYLRCHMKVGSGDSGCQARTCVCSTGGCSCGGSCW